MRECELLILGGGHVALGLAMAQENVLICEESEFADPGFSLTLKGFERAQPKAMSTAGEALVACYEALGLLTKERFHCSALEIGASRFALENGLQLLLKCKLLELRADETGCLATFITNSGLETIRAGKVVDLRPKSGAWEISALFTVLGKGSFESVARCFPEGRVERSFCSPWGALHLPVETDDYNQALESLCARWSVPEKLALIAPRLTCIPADGAILDGAFSDPIAAFEAGYRWGKEGL